MTAWWCPGGLHDFQNPSPDRVYLLHIVSSDPGFVDRLRHGFADRLRHGFADRLRHSIPPPPLDAEDLAVLRSL